jgi:hypothetical protein
MTDAGRPYESSVASTLTTSPRMRPALATPSGVRVVWHRLAGRRSRARPFTSFITSCIMAFVVSFGLVWLYVAACPILFLDKGYPIWVVKQTMLDQCQLGTVSVFGDSRTMTAIIPRALPFPVVNFALGGTTPIETYFAVRRALRCPSLPKLAIIGHVALNYVRDSDGWRFSARNRFFSFDDMRSIDQDAADLHDDVIEDPQSSNLQPWVRAWLYSVRFPSLWFNSIVNGHIAARWQRNLIAREDGVRSLGHYLVGTAPGSSEIDDEAKAHEFRVSPLIDRYFSRTLSLLAEKHVPVLVLSMPINHATCTQLQPQFRDQFADYLKTQADRFHNVILSEPAFPCWPDAFYGDRAHFNAAGATAFSRELSIVLPQILAGANASPQLDHW